MVEQRSKKPRKQATPARVKSAEPDTTVESLAAQLASLAAERDRLRMELDTALERIAMLEQVNADVSDRIAWVIDSLQTSAKA
ncbi:MAG: DUF4164 family protein [Hyphomicrobiaceae bacterium]